MMPDKPRSELSARERDARVAKALGHTVEWRYGYYYDGRPENTFVSYSQKPGERSRFEHEPCVSNGLPSHHSEAWQPIPEYTTDHNAAQQAISEVERRGLWEKYVFALAEIVHADIADNKGIWSVYLFGAFKLVRASPDNRCEAAVKVLEEAK